MTTNDSRTGNSSMSAARMDDDELDRRLSALMRTAEPPAENWTVIERRIRKRRWPTALSTALAAAAVLSGVALVVSQIVSVEATRTTGGGMAETVQAEVHAMRASAPVTPAGSDIDSPAAVMAAWQDNQQAIAQLEAALERDPDNRLLLEFLTEARMRQARLVRSIGHSQTPNDERSINL